MKRKCRVCKKNKEVSEFSKDSTGPGGMRSLCKKCDYSSNKKWRDLNKERYKFVSNRWRRANTDRVKIHAAKYRENHRCHALISGARSRARYKGVPFDLDRHRKKLRKRMDVGFCELTGIPLNFKGKKTFDAPSIDRIIPSLGYVYSNVRVVCYCVNCALGTWGFDKLDSVVRGWIKTNGKTKSSRSV